MTTLNELLRSACATYRSNIMLVDAASGTEITYGSFWADANATRRLLAAADPSEGPVALLGRNSIDWVRWESAAALAGRACVPLNYRLAAPEMLWQLDHSRATTLVFGPDFADAAAALSAERDELRLVPACSRASEPADDAVGPPVDMRTVQRIMYTSATTGSPKGVLTTHGRIVDNAVTTLANQLHDCDERARYLAATPLSHMAIGYLWPMVAAGATTIIMDQFDASAFCRAVQEHGVTHTLLAPTMIDFISTHVESNARSRSRLRDSNLRAIWYAGSSMPAATLQRAESLIGPRFNQQYGLTELWTAHRSMCATMLTAAWHHRKPGSCGRPLVGTEIGVFDDSGNRLAQGQHGELAVRGCGEAPLGYLRDAVATAETFRDGWVMTGDIGYVDEDEFVYIVDRKKDMIISGGFNVYSAELEAELVKHPAIRQSAVIGVPHAEWGETPWAFVVCDDAGLTEAHLKTQLRASLGGFKIPSRIVFVDELPIGATGKVLKRELREQVRTQLS